MQKDKLNETEIKSNDKKNNNKKELRFSEFTTSPN
jgi:hypothetical protein